MLVDTKGSGKSYIQYLCITIISQNGYNYIHMQLPHTNHLLTEEATEIWGQLKIEDFSMENPEI